MELETGDDEEVVGMGKDGACPERNGGKGEEGGTGGEENVGAIIE